MSNNVHVTRSCDNFSKGLETDYIDFVVYFVTIAIEKQYTLLSWTWTGVFYSLCRSVSHITKTKEKFHKFGS